MIVVYTVSLFMVISAYKERAARQYGCTYTAGTGKATGLLHNKN